MNIENKIQTNFVNTLQSLGEGLDLSQVGMIQHHNLPKNPPKFEPKQKAVVTAVETGSDIHHVPGGSVKEKAIQKEKRKGKDKEEKKNEKEREEIERKPKNTEINPNDAKND